MVAAVFPGQGSQAVGMGADIAAKWPSAAQRFAEASELLGFDLLATCAGGPEEKLAETSVAQPALFVAGFAVWEIVKAEGVEVSFFAGHSLGEYTACAAAGVFPFADGVKAVKARGEAMSAAASAHPGGMIALMSAAPEELDAWVAEAGKSGPVLIANRNSPEQVIVSGAHPALDVVEKAATAAGRRAVRLKVSGAFHSPLMAEAAARMTEVLGGMAMADPAVPVVGNVDGSALKSAAEVKSELETQLVSAVRWDSCVKTIVGGGVTRAVECGPGKVLAGLNRRNDRSLRTMTTGSAQDLEETLGKIKEVR